MLCPGQGGADGIVHALRDVAGRIKTIFRQEQRNAGRLLRKSFLSELKCLELSDDDESDDEQCEGVNCALDSLDDALEHISNAEKEIQGAAEQAQLTAAVVKNCP
mgnify:CR=1 FL=1